MSAVTTRELGSSLGTLMLKGARTSELIVAIQAGIPVADMEALRRKLNISLEDLARRLAISKATLHRRKAHDGKLTMEESDRLVRFARLFGWAAEVLGSEAAAQAWLCSPQYGLGGAIPLDYATTEVGARAVEDLLGRIEFGVYS